MSEELKPCPFCGGEAAFDYDDNGWNWIFCKACDASTDARVSAMDDCKPLLSEAWNRRADDTLRAENKRLNQQVELYEQAMNASWPEGAVGDAFDYWNTARKLKGTP